MIRRIINKVFGRKPRADGSRAQILPLSAHGIRRDQLDDCALKTCETLAQAGYKGYLVGGAVRDLLLNMTPKDFDVATDATPEEVRRLFRRSRIIGRRFQIVHVMCGRETIEVTTFRANGQKETEEDNEHVAGDKSPAAHKRLTDEHGRLLSDNVFGSMADDAARRDFTINALYYDPAREEVHDYFGGVADCKKRVLRMIGDPDTRYREDPVRMLRAARFAAKLDFHIDPETRKPVAALAPLLANIPRARIFDEALKLLLSGHALRGVHQLRAEGLHHGMLPLLDTILDDPTGERFINAALKSTDERIQSDRPSSPAFLFGTLLWPQVLLRWRALEAAEKGFQQWRKVSPFDRYKIMRKAANLMRERADTIASIMTREQGKPLAEAKMETMAAADVIDWFSEEARRTYGQIIPARAPGVMQMAIKLPVGPVAAFTPWNFPINLPAKPGVPELQIFSIQL
ncbi:MAG: polynucleotide adenylyltransferase PcnB, partial [Betaproteobacteria bacterium]|nr:polynucleotide adenylyltransferase PcnB [Betaproteobacteria bacterium]